MVRLLDEISDQQPSLAESKKDFDTEPWVKDANSKYGMKKGSQAAKEIVEHVQTEQIKRDLAAYLQHRGGSQRIELPVPLAWQKELDKAKQRGWR